jgi:hypothetical protein
MTSPFLQGSGVVPEATALSLRGIQTDTYGEVLGGHKALFDFDQSGVTGLLTAGEVKNLISGGDGMTVSQAFVSGDPVEAKKGANFTSGGSGEVLLMPEVYDLNTLGAEASLVISNWITNDMDVGAGFPAIMGYARQTNTNNQWSINHENTQNTFVTRVSGSKHTFVVPNGAAFLLTMYIKKTSSGVYSFTTYLNDVAVGSTAGKSYPFITPSDGMETRNVGTISGFTSTWEGTVHRMQLLKVDPTAFDIDAWIAAEIAANGSRF